MGLFGSGIQDFRSAADGADKLVERLHALITQFERNGLEITVFGVKLLVKVAES